MPKMSESAMQDILRAVSGRPDGAPIQDIRNHLAEIPPLRTLQYRLKHLIGEGRLTKTGEGRGAKYFLASDLKYVALGAPLPEGRRLMAISKPGDQVRAYVNQAEVARRPVGYNRDFLNSYRPNESAYLTTDERERLAAMSQHGAGPAGTYATHILNRLLIDLAWNSSRLEGNTYSLADTKRLIEMGQEAEGRPHREAQMILNHKDAIEFLVGSAEDIGFNRYTILNLHGHLANNLLTDPAAVGRLRYIGVAIDGSVFHPLEGPQLISECFDQVLMTAEAISDPFEQSFFCMVHLPYLQPFDDVNKRVSRLAANIPFIKRNLSPLAFTDVPVSLYTAAMIGVYELNAVALLKDVFLWAYERSADRYKAVRQSLGEPDPLRLRYRAELRDVISRVIFAGLGRSAAAAFVADYARNHISEADQASFRDMAEAELAGLHEGNFARYQARPSQFSAWQTVWKTGESSP